jgi:hypothetical protein
MEVLLNIDLRADPEHPYYSIVTTFTVTFPHQQPVTLQILSADIHHRARFSYD